MSQRVRLRHPVTSNRSPWCACSSRMSKPELGLWRALSIGFEAAVAALPEALKKEGFGVLTEIDLQATLKTKLAVEMRPYRIFGACNPSFANAAVGKRPEVGVLLPCNVVLYEREDGTVMAGSVDPMQTLGSQAAGLGLNDLARELKVRLERVLDTLAKQA